MDEFLTLIDPLLEPNLLYLVVVGAAWVSVLALFHPGSGVLEVIAGVGILAGASGLIYLGAGALALILLAVSFALYALAVWRSFPDRAGTEADVRGQTAFLLALAATVMQGVGGALYVNVPGVSLAVVVIAALVSLGIEQWALVPAIRALRPPPQAGIETLIGARAEVRRAPEAPGQPGMVYLNGELWQALSDDPLAAGDEVEVVGRDGMRLHVRKAP